MLGLIIGSIAILILAIILFIQVRNKKIDLEQQQKKEKQIKQNIDALNCQLDDQQKDFQALNDLIKNKQKDIDSINKSIKEKESLFKTILSNANDLKKRYDSFQEQEKDKIKERLEEFKEISNKAAENYFDELQKAYEHADAAHAEKMTRLKAEQDSAAAALNNLKETRKAAHEALLKQQEIKENKDNYRLKPSDVDLYDIRSLKHLSKTFHKPRVISMLIWQYYFQPIAKKQFPVILQGKTKTGIYKITNLYTDQSYIGQSVDVYKRWTDHCKAGLGIDAPVGNRLYQKMGSDGLQNFTFELLCECSKEELDEKERYFVELYQADLYGYNGTKGNK